jgi:TP901 family phage tail tape measure protein
MALAETAELAVRISLKDNVSAGVGRLQRNLGGLSKSIGQVGKGFGQVGAGLTRAGFVVGGAAITGITAAAKAAIDFEDAFAGVRKTVDETDLAAAGLSFEDLARQFRDMATEIPIAATELAAIGETAGALGIRAQDIEEFTRTVALMGATTNLTTAEASESLGKIGTILNLTGDQFEDFADILVNLGNKGASTEAEIIEITKRFAASGRQAGLSVPQILAYASAIASAGAEPEAAGSSLSRLFGNLITETARATDKGKAFAKVVGKSFKDFSKIVETDTNGAMIAFLQSLNKLDAFGQQRALKEVGITNVRDRNAILLLAGTIETNLLPAFENANDAAGALSVEAQKRFDTLASKIKLFKANIIEAAITVGEGMVPALGRATDKLIGFLKLSENKSRLANLGKEIGDAIDSIDWNAVLTAADQFVGILKGALSFAKLMYDAFSALPGPIKEATAGFLVLNKLSGGLVGAGIGNIVGGLAGAGLQGIASRAPGVGRLFAQPVFVTNFPPGFGTGLGGPGAGGGKLGLLGALFPAAGILAIGYAIGDAIVQATGGQVANTPDAGRGRAVADFAGLEIVIGQNTAALVRAEDARKREAAQFGPPTPKGIAQAVRGTEVFGPPRPPGMGGASIAERDERRQADLAGVMERAVAAGFRPSAAAIEATLRRNETHLIGVKAAVGTAAQQTAFAIRDSEPAPKPPVVNVTTNVSVSATNVVHKYVQIRRTGPTGGSREKSGPLEFG